MPFCLTCSTRNTCKGICDKVAKLLNSREIRGYSPAQIKRKERLFPTDELERIAGERAFRLKFGHRKIPNHLKED